MAKRPNTIAAARPRNAPLLEVLRMILSAALFDVPDAAAPVEELFVPLSLVSVKYIQMAKDRGNGECWYLVPDGTLEPDPAVPDAEFTSRTRVITGTGNIGKGRVRCTVNPPSAHCD